MTNYEDMLSAFGLTAPPQAKPKGEKGVQIRSRTIDGVVYVRATDVIDLLETNGLLPITTASLKRAITR